MLRDDIESMNSVRKWFEALELSINKVMSYNHSKVISNLFGIGVNGKWIEVK